ncbi:cytochrome P450, partial [Marasmius fiardii PR-910]
LTASTITYRLSPYHPLADIPGPKMFKMSKLWRAYICWKGDQHRVLKALHDEYGTIVRTGPNEVSVIDVPSMKAVLGHNGLPKGHGYQVRRDTRTEGSLLELVGDPHAARRRIWNRGMNTEALREYEGIITKRANQLVDALQVRQKVDLASWLGYFTVDFMADMAFGGTTGPKMVENGADKIGLLDLIEMAAKTTEILTHVSWISLIPGYQTLLAKNVQRMLDFGREWSDSRMKTGARTKDLWYHLTDEAGIEKVRPSRETVTSDSALAIVAGSDTAASAMTCLFWFLLSHPECYKRLQKEVDEVYPSDVDALDSSKHSEMKYLGACINETLRLMPPVPSGGPRTVPRGSGGKDLAGHFLPEGTTVYVPPYCLHRRPYHFYPQTESFVPSRWLSDPDFNPTSNAPSPPSSVGDSGHILNTEAFIPFSYGPTSCVGKNLARREMMMVICLLLQRFQFRFERGFEWETWLDGVQDYFVALRKPLRVEVVSRC